MLELGRNRAAGDAMAAADPLPTYCIAPVFVQWNPHRPRSGWCWQGEVPVHRRPHLSCGDKLLLVAFSFVQRPQPLHWPCCVRVIQIC